MKASAAVSILHDILNDNIGKTFNYNRDDFSLVSVLDDEKNNITLIFKDSKGESHRFNLKTKKED